MKKKLLISVFVAFLLFPCFSLKAQRNQLERPKVVIGIVVDQMRWDYLYRFYNRYEEGGFKRLLNQGFSFENTFINYVPSYTAVGHTVIYTGSVPAITGIVGNNWINQLTGEEWYCTEDPTVETIGSSGSVGQMSPKRMLVTTVTDELRLATNFRGKVVGVSLKDRASMLPAGHSPSGAFWYDNKTSDFITSSYYMNELPQWVQAFNNRDIPQELMNQEWSTLYPIESYIQSSDDNVSWEGTFSGEKEPTFPHDLAQIFKRDKGAIRSTPFGNTLTLKFAQAAIEGYQLGEVNITDFLTVNLASTDYVGHKFGPNSIEVEDTYLRLDQELAHFFDALDEKFGQGNYLVFLTADHAGAHSTGFMQKHKLPSGDEKLGDLQQNLNKYLSKRFQGDKLVRSFINDHVVYDMDKVQDAELDFDLVKEATVEFLKKQPVIQFAVDIERIGEAPIPEPIKTKIINGYNYKRTGAVVFIPNSGWMNGNATGTTHGTWTPYDSHIPLVFMGWGIEQGTSHRHVRMSDIAPTIAALLHIQMGSGNVGTPLVEVLD